MTKTSTGSTLEDLHADHNKEAEVLRNQLAEGEEVDMYVVGRDSEVLALTQDRLHIVKSGMMHRSDGHVSQYAYRDLTHVAVHASSGHFAFEVRTEDTLVPDPRGAAFDNDYDLPNVVPFEESELPAFEKALAQVRERVARARA